MNSYSKYAEGYLRDRKTFYKSGNYEAALTEFLKYMEKKSKEMSVWYWSGWTCYQLTRYSEAIDHLKKANTIKESWYVYHGLG